MTRIIAGAAGGRRLDVPKGDATRPTTDRVREALFSGLDARGLLRGARVLDLFAGSGALGLEAASRGAAEVVLVDCAREAAAAARRNVAALGMPRVTVVLSTAQRYLHGPRPGWQADLVLADPPYSAGEEVLAAVLQLLVGGDWLAEGAVLVIERSSRSPEPRWPAGLARQDVRRYGETTLWLAGRSAAVD